MSGPEMTRRESFAAVRSILRGEPEPMCADCGRRHWEGCASVTAYPRQYQLPGVEWGATLGGSARRRSAIRTSRWALLRPMVLIGRARWARICRQLRDADNLDARR